MTQADDLNPFAGVMLLCAVRRKGYPLNRDWFAMAPVGKSEEFDSRHLLKRAVHPSEVFIARVYCTRCLSQRHIQ